MNRYALLSVLVLPAPVVAQPEPRPLAVTHVTVIDTTGGPSMADMTVVVTGDRITAIGKAKDVTVPKDAPVIDGTGKFLIPGLWDMHVHWTDKPSLDLFTANGVTGIRIMWGVPQHLEWRKEVADGSLLGPRMVVASNIMDGPKPVWEGSLAISTPEDARCAVQDAKRAGYDFIKVYSTLSKDSYLAIADEAKKCGLPFAGHIPTHSVSAAEASEAGQRSVEHLHGVGLACSSEEATLRKRLADAAGDRELFIRTSEQILETHDEKKAAALFALFKKNGTWQVPTLTVHRAGAYRDDPKFRDDSRVKYLPPSVKKEWEREVGKERRKEVVAYLKQRYEHDLKLVPVLYKAGVRILAGTDVANPYCFPGFSLHDELELLVKAGLTPPEALKTATLNPAKFLGREKDLGTVERGKLADLVLLDADPLKDIKNTKKIATVVVGGKLQTREALDKMLAEVEAAASKPAPPRSETPTTPAFVISPERVLHDREPSIQLLNLNPGQRVTVRARRGPFKSEVEFDADAKGKVDVGGANAKPGEKVAPLKILWSMKLDPDEKDQTIPPSGSVDPLKVSLTALVDGKEVGAGGFEMIYVSPDVERVPVKDGKLRGAFFRPKAKGKYPGVMRLGGSEGGLWESNAALLAAHGYAVLNLAYFRYNDLPSELVEIPLEYFEEGLAWLEKQECVAAGRLAVIGGSRGGELALLLGSSFPTIKAVVAYVPAHVVGRSISSERNAAAWTHKGKPIAWLDPKVDEAERRKVIEANPGNATPLWRLMLSDTEAVKRAAIPVERIAGAVLLISGKDDRTCPSAEMAEEFVKRLRENKHPHTVLHLPYDDAGHLIGIPNRPMGDARFYNPGTMRWREVGGTPQGNAYASSDSWKEMLKFLDEAFNKK